jgi:diketogulonate reductase-like aldo/keto reductase
MVDQGVPLPVVNQIDLHPFMRHPDIVSICEKHNIVLEVSHHLTTVRDELIVRYKIRPGDLLPEQCDSVILLLRK